MLKKVLLFGVYFILMISDVQAMGFVQSMNVKIGVFDAASVKLDYSNRGEAYNISAEMSTANFFGKMYPFTAKYMSKGVLLKDDVLPYVYETYTKSRNHVRTKKIFYDEKGKAYKRISTKDEKVNEREINDVPETADSADLQTIFANLIGNFSISPMENKFLSFINLSSLKKIKKFQKSIASSIGGRCIIIIS